MRERPILFSAEMVRAILENRKTQTRRVVQPFPLHDSWGRWNGIPRERQRPCPYGQPGDGLWVRETWADSFASDDDSHNGYVYAATNHGPEPRRWRPSILMPRLASRITLEITGVRVERVNSISVDDCIREGIATLPDGTIDGHHSVKVGFMQLWDSLNAKRGYGWDANPFCWVIEFKRIEGTRP